MPMSKEDLQKLLQQAFPDPSDAGFVTRGELKDLMEIVEKRTADKLFATELQLRLEIKNSEMSQKNWILSGVIAMMISGGAGYMALRMQLDRLETSLPRVESTLLEQIGWMKSQERRDDHQDQGIRQANPKYVVPVEKTNAS